MDALIASSTTTLHSKANSLDKKADEATEALKICRMAQGVGPALGRGRGKSSSVKHGKLYPAESQWVPQLVPQ